MMISMQETIENKLIAELSPTHLKVENDSIKHKGHAGDDGSGESHFLVAISSDEFKGLSRAKCHTMVVKILANEFEAVHSISISVKL